MYADTRDLYMEYLRRVKRAVKDSELEAVVLASPVNVTCASGAKIHTQVTIPKRLVAIVVTSDGDVSMLAADIEENLARRESVIDDISVYVEFARSPTEAIAEKLEQLGAGASRIGIEQRFMVVDYMDQLERCFPRRVS